MTKRTTSKSESSQSEAATPADATSIPKPLTTRAGTKQSALIAMLRGESGATIDEIAAATGWQSHTVRGAMSGALKKRLGLVITSEKVEGRGRMYRLPPV
jgi:predicted transcriptional regulator